MLRIAYDVVKPILNFHVCTEAEKYFQMPCDTDQATSHYLNQWWLIHQHIYASRDPNELKQQLILSLHDFHELDFLLFGVMSWQQKDLLLPTISTSKIVLSPAYQYYNLACLLTHKQLETLMCVYGCGRHFNYWYPGASAPGHQHPKCWLNIHFS